MGWEEAVGSLGRKRPETRREPEADPETAARRGRIRAQIASNVVTPIEMQHCRDASARAFHRSDAVSQRQENSVSWVL